MGGAEASFKFTWPWSQQWRMATENDTRVSCPPKAAWHFRLSLVQKYQYHEPQRGQMLVVCRPQTGLLIPSRRTKGSVRSEGLPDSSFSRNVPSGGKRQRQVKAADTVASPMPPERTSDYPARRSTTVDSVP